MDMKKEPAENQTTGANEAAINEYRKHLWDALRAGQEQYDKYLLTLSSGGLAISMMLLKDVFGKTQLVYPAILVGSWVLFCLCILATVASFITSQQCLRSRLQKYEKCVETGNFDNANDSEPLEWVTNVLNYVSGVFFLLAIAATITFASINLTRGKLMTTDLEELKKGYTAPQIPILQKINGGYVPPQPPAKQQQQQTTPPPAKK